MYEDISEYDSSEEEFVLDDEMEVSGSSTSESELADSDNSDDEDPLLQARQWYEVDTKLPANPPPPRFPFIGKYSRKISWKISSKII